MKILCISYEYPPLGGGGAPVCERLCRALVKAGNNVDVLTSQGFGLPKIETRDGVRIYRTACIRRNKHYTGPIELGSTLIPAYFGGARLAKANDYDLIHCHFIVPSGFVAFALSKRFGIPYVLTAHGSDVPGYNPDRFEYLHKIIRPLWYRIVCGARAVTTPSKYLRNLINSHVGAEIDLIPNTFKMPPLSSTRREKRVLAVSRLFERKGMQYLVNAFRQLDTDWELVIAGDGPYFDTLQNLCKDLFPRVRLVGYVRGQELHDLYASSKIFVLPSIRENFPVVLLEAMHAGCAVITTLGSGCEEVVGEAGVLVEQENETMLAEAIRHFIQHDEEREIYSQRSRKRAAQFGEAAVAGKFEDLFRRCLRTADKRSNNAI